MAYQKFCLGEFWSKIHAYIIHRSNQDSRVLPSYPEKRTERNKELVVCCRIGRLVKKVILMSNLCMSAKLFKVFFTLQRKRLGEDLFTRRTKCWTHWGRQSNMNSEIWKIKRKQWKYYFLLLFLVAEILKNMKELKRSWFILWN